ncbi:TSC22 domain family protein 1, partial [Ophiophagus hannah]
MANGPGAASNASGSVGHSAGGSMAAGHLQPAGSTSRFRVVKLDSSSEHFKKGRWTCTEFYDKENYGPVAESAPVAKTVDALLDVASERESTSGSSVSSTLSHYTESVGSGEMGAPPGMQPQGFQGGPLPMDFTSAGGTPELPQSMSQSQLSQVQPHPQEVSYPPQKQGVPPPASAVPPPLTIVGGHQPTLASQPFTPPPVPAGPVAPQPQPLPFGQGQAQHPAALPPMPRQMAPGQHAKPVAQTSLPEYIQPPQMLPASSLQPGTAIVGSGSAPPSMPLPVQAHLPGVPSQAQPAIPAVGTPAALMNVGQPGSAAPVAQRPSVANQMASSVLGPSAAVPAPSQGAPPVPTGAVHPGSQSVPSGLPQSLGIPPPGNLMPMQATDPLVQGMAQLPPVSPIPSVSAVPGHSASSMPPAPVSLAPSKTLAQPSSMQNGSLVQNASQPALLPMGMNLPGAPSSSQFSAQSLAQSIASRTEEAKRPAEAFLVGLTQPPGGAESSSSLCTSSALADGSMVSSLFPLKGLPLAALDGEEDSRGRNLCQPCTVALLGCFQKWMVSWAGIAVRKGCKPLNLGTLGLFFPFEMERGVWMNSGTTETGTILNSEFPLSSSPNCIKAPLMREEMWGMKLKLSCVDLKSHPKETQGRNVGPGGYFHPWVKRVGGFWGQGSQQEVEN